MKQLHFDASLVTPATIYLPGAKMPLYRLNGKQPLIDASAYVAPGAAVIGNVRIGNSHLLGESYPSGCAVVV